jgi:replicative DNA helicase
LTKIVSHETRKTDNREREVSRISTMLKDTAKDLGITIVVMSQLSRLSEQRADRRPMASDLRDSGQIEQDADKIILLHKPGIGKVTLYGRDGTRYIEFIVAKNRNGRVGACDLYYDYQNMTFKNLMPENNG